MHLFGTPSFSPAHRKKPIGQKTSIGNIPSLFINSGLNHRNYSSANSFEDNSNPETERKFLKSSRGGNLQVNLDTEQPLSKFLR